MAGQLQCGTLLVSCNSKEVRFLPATHRLACTFNAQDMPRPFKRLKELDLEDVAEDILTEHAEA